MLPVLKKRIVKIMSTDTGVMFSTLVGNRNYVSCKINLQVLITGTAVAQVEEWAIQ